MAFPALLAAADRAALNALGSPVSYAPEFGASVQVRGIFDSAYQRAEPGQFGVAVVAAVPAVFVLLADLPSDPALESPTVEVAGLTYRVREAQKDGMGGVVLLLQERD